MLSYFLFKEIRLINYFLDFKKAKFLRLQKILSRNVILIPLCAVFSVLSAFTIFASTLTDHYELISYDVEFLRKQVELENNRSLAELNKATGLNFTFFDFVQAANKRTFDPPPALTKPPPMATVAMVSTSGGGDAHHSPHHNSEVNNQEANSGAAVSERGRKGDAVVEVDIDASLIGKLNSPYKNDLAERRAEMIRHQLEKTYVYEVSEMIRDYHIVRRIGYTSYVASSTAHELVNSSIKTNILYGTYSGIWKFCNYLSSKCEHFFFNSNLVN